MMSRRRAAGDDTGWDSLNHDLGIRGVCMPEARIALSSWCN
jgi:hypothetical protein